MTEFTNSPNRFVLRFIAGIKQFIRGELQQNEKLLLDSCQQTALSLQSEREAILLEKEMMQKFQGMPNLGPALDRWIRSESRLLRVAENQLVELTDRLDELERRMRESKGGAGAS